MEYNGWTNKATWLVKLWIDNDQGEQDYWLSEAKNSPDIYTLEQALIDYHEEQLLGLRGSNGLGSDLMSWALALVDWAAIARALIEDAAEVGA